MSKCSDKTAKPGKGDNGSSDYDEGSSDDGDNDTDFGSKSEGVSLAPTATTDASAHLSTKVSRLFLCMEKSLMKEAYKFLSDICYAFIATTISTGTKCLG